MEEISMLERYGENLTEKEYITDPAIGKEIERKYVCSKAVRWIFKLKMLIIVPVLEILRMLVYKKVSEDILI